MFHHVIQTLMHPTMLEKAPLQMIVEIKYQPEGQVKYVLVGKKKVFWNLKVLLCHPLAASPLACQMTTTPRAASLSLGRAHAYRLQAWVN